MPVEMEAKLKVDALDATRDKLRALRATPAGTRLETNTLYDTDAHSLLGKDKGLRLRVRRDLETGHEDAILTFKGPRQPGPYKSREEIETHVNNPKAMGAMLVALGFKQALSFEKRRESWELDGCHIELDEIPHFGCFVEIEGFSAEAIAGMQRRLGLEGTEPIQTSYVAMLMDWLESQDQSSRLVVFPRS